MQRSDRPAILLMRSARKILAVLFFLLASPTRAEEMVIIVNLSNGVSSMSREEVAWIFLNKNIVFADGVRIKAVTPAETDPLRTRFEQEVLGKSEFEIRAYWSRLVFNGKGKPPLALESEDAVRKFVETERAAIGYVREHVAGKNVKIIYRHN